MTLETEIKQVYKSIEGDIRLLSMLLKENRDINDTKPIIKLQEAFDNLEKVNLCLKQSLDASKKNEWEVAENEDN